METEDTEIPHSRAISFIVVFILTGSFIHHSAISFPKFIMIPIGLKGYSIFLSKSAITI